MSGKDVLKVASIFRTIQGEATETGFPSVFVRLYGCNLNCSYCDTPQEKDGYKEMTLDSIVSRVKSYAIHRVCITGGEPLVQQEGVTTLCKMLVRDGYMVSIETNGSFDILSLEERRNSCRGRSSWSYCMDMKLPSAGEREYHSCLRKIWKNILKMGSRDCVKFVVASENDIHLAMKIIEDIAKVWVDSLPHCIPPAIFISPVDKFGIQSDIAKKAAEAIMELERVHGIPVRLQVQLHKVIGIL